MTPQQRDATIQHFSESDQRPPLTVSEEPGCDSLPYLAQGRRCRSRKLKVAIQLTPELD